MKIMKKKSLSEMVAYVMLIVIAVSISVLVYIFLKSYIVRPQEACPDNLALSIDEYLCNQSDSTIKLTILNTGNFNITGFIIRISNESGKPPLQVLGERIGGQIRTDIKPKESKEFAFSYLKYKKIVSLDIQPFRLQDKKIILCENAVINQEIENCE